MQSIGNQTDMFTSMSCTVIAKEEIDTEDDTYTDEFYQAESFPASNRGHTEHDLLDQWRRTKESSI